MTHDGPLTVSQMRDKLRVAGYPNWQWASDTEIISVFGRVSGQPVNGCVNSDPPPTTTMPPPSSACSNGNLCLIQPSPSPFPQDQASCQAAGGQWNTITAFGINLYSYCSLPNGSPKPTQTPAPADPCPSGPAAVSKIWPDPLVFAPVHETTSVHGPELHPDFPFPDYVCHVNADSNLLKYHIYYDGGTWHVWNSVLQSEAAAFPSDTVAATYVASAQAVSVSVHLQDGSIATQVMNWYLIDGVLQLRLGELRA